MKGFVFTELIEMVEARFGIAVADAMLDADGLASGGAYVATATYDHAEIVLILRRLSAATAASLPELLRSYGEHLFGRLRALFPGFFEAPHNAFELLASVNDVVHMEVRKLYPDAELPQFDCERVDEARMRLHYHSPRGMADLAEGLIRGCCHSYGEEVWIERTDVSGGALTDVVFDLTRQAPPGLAADRRP